MPLLKQRRVLAGKLETTPGTGVTLTSGTDGLINAYDVTPDADISMNERMSYGGFGLLAGVPGAYAGSLKFKMEACGSGTAGTAPAWSLVCLESCGMAQASGLFTFVSSGASQKSATFGIYEDGAIKKLTGAMGSWTLNANNGKIPYFEFTYKGIWNAPTDGSMFTPQFGTLSPPRTAGMTLTVGAYTPTCSKLTIAQGNEVTLREDVTQTSGYISALITGRKVTGSLDPETTTVATYDAFGTFLAGTTAELTATFVGGTGAGFTVVAPALQYNTPKEGNRNGEVTTTLPFFATQNGTTVDSELSIQF